MSKGNLSKIDNLGRVVIPKSIRKALNIEHNDEISMYVEGESLVIKKGKQYFRYPIKTSPFEFILDKSYLINKIKDYSTNTASQVKL